MTAETLETRTAKESQMCPECGTTFDLAARQEQTRQLPKPNTANEYCTDKCWLNGVAGQEYA